MGRKSDSVSSGSCKSAIRSFWLWASRPPAFPRARCVFVPFEQLLGTLAPGAEVVFVEHHQVPVHRVQPFVLRLDVPGGIAPQQVLERSEIHHRLALVDLRRVAARRARQVLPAVKVHMAFQVGLPGVFHRRLEGHHQHSLGLELFGQLVGGEGLAEPHLGVPQEARRGVHVFLPDGVEVGMRLVHRLGLLGAHGRRSRGACRRSAGPVRSSASTVARPPRCSAPIRASGSRSPSLHQRRAHLVVGEDRAVVALRRLVHLDAVVLDGRGLELLGHALLHVARGLAHLEQAGVRRR
jgi:hypothetical protein